MLSGEVVKKIAMASLLAALVCHERLSVAAKNRPASRLCRVRAPLLGNAAFNEWCPQSALGYVS